jgi:hypothetical protein
MGRAFRKTAVGVLLVLALALPRAASAQSGGEEARRLFEEGVAALQREDYATALVAFQRAQELSPRPILLYNIGMCRRALLQFPEAIETFQQYLAETATDPEVADARVQVAQLVAEMEGQLSQVTVLVNVDGAMLYLDGSQAGATPLVRPLRVGPGSHVLEARREGYHDARLAFDVMAGEDTQVQLTLEALPAPPPPPPVTPVEEDGGGVATKWWFWTIIGVVVVGGAVTAGVLLWPEEAPGPADWAIHGP